MTGLLFFLKYIYIYIYILYIRTQFLFYKCNREKFAKITRRHYSKTGIKSRQIITLWTLQVSYIQFRVTCTIIRLKSVQSIVIIVWCKVTCLDRSTRDTYFAGEKKNIIILTLKMTKALPTWNFRNFMS